MYPIAPSGFSALHPIRLSPLARGCSVNPAQQRKFATEVRREKKSLTVDVFSNNGRDRGTAVTDKRHSSWRPYQPQESRPTTVDEYYQRVGGLVVVPGLLREMGGDPTVILPRAGLETSALDHVENRIPYASMGHLFHECALATGCPHFGLLAYQRVRLSHLGLPGS